VRQKVVRATVLACVVAAALVIAPTGRAAAIIQPGTAIVTGDAGCTLNWIYDGIGGNATGKVFVGTAAHCVEFVGQRVALDEVDSPPNAFFGSVAYISGNLDYSLIQIDSAWLGNVSAAMRGHPDIPRGVSTQATAAIGDFMQFSGNGVVLNLTQPTREERIGILGYNDGEQQFVYGVITPGDSGGPVADLTDGNKAFGIVDTVGVAVTPLPQAGEGGVALEGLLNDAAAHGFNVRVRTV
jgi:hypothetical protein